MSGSQIINSESSVVKEESGELSRFFHMSGELLCILSLEGVFVRVNHQWERLLGHENDKLENTSLLDLVHPDDLGDTKQSLAYLSKGLPLKKFENRLKDALGKYHLIEWALTPDQDSGKYYAVARDVTEEKQISERLKHAAALFEGTSDGVIILNGDMKIISINHAFANITGYNQKEIIGQSLEILCNINQTEDIFAKLKLAVRMNTEWQGETLNQSRLGKFFSAWLNVSKVHDENTGEVQFVGVFSDISSIKESQRQLEYLAHHDTLTSLPNRLLLKARLEQSIQRAGRDGKSVALLFMDLDRFKQINDSMGHSQGDELLRTIAKRLKSCVRKQDTVARLGGDEFIVMLDALTQKLDVTHITQKIVDAVSKPVRLEQGEISPNCSVGISLFPDDGTDFESLLRNADSAMYVSKNEGGAGYHYYTEDLTSKAMEAVQLENELRKALEKDEFILAYQPKIDLTTQEIKGVEALIRWKHPTIGVIPPFKFIPLAESTGLVIPMGKWVLEKACEQAKDWQERGINFGSLAVNVAGPQIQRSNFVETVNDVLASTQLHPQYLELEVTESFIMSEPEKCIDTLKELKKCGVTLSIDDFGTDYSSLSYLKRLPIDKLKIDKSFVDGLPDKDDDVAIAKAIIALAKSLNLELVAEGIEELNQCEFLIKNACEQGQGYLFSAPLAAGDFEAFASEWKGIQS